MTANGSKTTYRAAAFLLCLVLLAAAVFALPSAEAFAEDGAPVVTIGPGAFEDPTPIAAAEDGAAVVTRGPGAFEDPTPIATAEDMFLLAEDPTGYFVLTKDIDMSGVDWTPIAFSGALYGSDCTIYNLKIARFGEETYPTVDGNDKVYETVCAGLFSALNSAWIQDLAIQGADINVRGEQNCFAGALAGWIKDTIVRNVTISDTRVRLTAACLPEAGAADNGKPRTSCNAGVGGLAGFGSATVEDCNISVTLVFTDECDPSLKVEEFMGAVVSAGNVALSGTTVNIDGWASCRGYAHNGGLVGMFYVYDKAEEQGFIDGCRVDGSITFFENNKDRRAYCDPYIGEKMTWPKLTNLSNGFKNKETLNYNAKMDPEQCDSPQITDRAIPGNCSDLGYTEHICAVCGNTWKDSFTAKVHQPGDWEDVSFAVNGVDGLRIRKCALCGLIVEEEILYAPRKMSVEPAALKISYKETAQLAPVLEPENAYVEGLVWTSSDEKVATVSPDGTVTAAGRGECVITCSTADGFLSAEVPVTVNYTPLQWLIKIVLFGWIWY